MNYVKGQFVALPYVEKLNELKIKYTDLLIYISIRSFDGNEGCFPSYESIAKRARGCRTYAIKAVKRLEDTKLITVEHSKQKDVSNRYKFAKSKRFEQITYQIFNVDLTMYEKSMLLCLRQLVNTTGSGKTHQTVNQISDFLGLSYRQVYKPLMSLIKKGFVEQGRDKLGKFIAFTDKISWNMDYSKKQLNLFPKLKVS
jgi:predicted transcriptional regulator